MSYPNYWNKYSVSQIFNRLQTQAWTITAATNKNYGGYAIWDYNSGGMFYWSQYSAQNPGTWAIESDGFSINLTGVNASSAYVYNNRSYNLMNGSSNWFALGNSANKKVDYYYTFVTDSYRFLKSELFYNKTNNIYTTRVMYVGAANNKSMHTTTIYKWTRTATNSRGNLVQANVTSTDANTYPQNGIHTDGYWYTAL